MATTTVQQFAADQRISLRAEWTDHNPYMEDHGDSMDNWRVTLTRKGTDRTARMSLVYSKGVGHNGAEPTVDEVLDCLASDAAGIDNAQGFEDWAGEYGYDTDSRKAERAYRATERQAARLRSFLGEDGFQELLYQTERQ